MSAHRLWNLETTEEVNEMFFRLDNDVYCKTSSVGIYEESKPDKTLYRASPGQASMLVSNLNQRDCPEAFICEKCGCLLVVLEYVEKSMRFLKVKDNRWESEWKESRLSQWEYLCNRCKASVPQEQLAEMGVIEL